MPIGLILVPFAWALRSRRLAVGARHRFANLSHRHLYTMRALVVLSVVAVLPPLSFFRNSKLLEDTLHIRAAQLHAASAWNARERTIEGLEKEVPLAKQGAKSPRCAPSYDDYLSSYFKTKVTRQPEMIRHNLVTFPKDSDHLDVWFLHFAHFLHHSFNQIGAEALGVLGNPALPGTSAAPGTSAGSATSAVPGTPALAGAPALPDEVFQEGDLSEWEWVRHNKDPEHLPLQLWVHEGTEASNTCAAPNEPDLLVESALPTGQVSLASNAVTFAAVIAIMSLLFWLVARRIFLFDLGEPLSESVDELQEALKGAGNVLVLTASRQDWSPKLAGGDTARIDVRELALEPDWAEKFDTAKVRAEGTVVVENFDWELVVPEFNRQRLILMEWLVAHCRKVIIVSAVDPSPFLIDVHGSESDGDAGRWAAVLGVFTRINVGHKSSWDLGEEIQEKLPALWRECNVQPELQRVADNLWHTSNCQSLHPEQLVSEVGERAAQYYYLEWRSCTPEECFLLAGLARDGTVNPKNTSSLRQLLRRRLIVRDPQFRIMNESFRRFALAHAFAMQEEWDAEAAGSGWGKARGPFATALVLVGLFLLSTQQQFLQTSSGLLTAAGGAVAALLKLIGVVQGTSSNT